MWLNYKKNKMDKIHLESDHLDGSLDNKQK